MRAVARRVHKCELRRPEWVDTLDMDRASPAAQQPMGHVETASETSIRRWYLR
jgi:hypothetical protein